MGAGPVYDLCWCPGFSSSSSSSAAAAAAASSSSPSPDSRRALLAAAAAAAANDADRLLAWTLPTGTRVAHAGERCEVGRAARPAGAVGAGAPALLWAPPSPSSTAAGDSASSRSSSSPASFPVADLFVAWGTCVQILRVERRLPAAAALAAARSEDGARRASAGSGGEGGGGSGDGGGS